MAIARLLALKNLQRRLLASTPTTSSSSSFLLSQNVSDHKRSGGSELLRTLSSSSSSAAAAGEGREVSVSEGGKKSKLFPRRRRRGGPGGLLNWKRNTHEFPPLWGLGNALIQASESINRLMENLSPSQLIGRVKEKDECYKLRFDVPGLDKDDLKIIVEDGILTIKGEHKEEEEEEEGSLDGDDGQFWSSSRSYGYYNSSMILPDDAKVDEIKAEMKNGVLTLVIPRTEKPKNDVKEIRVN